MSNRKFKTSEILERVENGQMLEELREKITEVVVGVINGGKKAKGSVNLKLDIAKLTSNQITVDHTVTAKPPRRQTMETVLFVTDSYELTGDNPDQQRLEGTH